jgi:hypothetical protein
MWFTLGAAAVFPAALSAEENDGAPHDGRFFYLFYFGHYVAPFLAYLLVLTLTDYQRKIYLSRKKLRLSE